MDPRWCPCPSLWPWESAHGDYDGGFHHHYDDDPLLFLAKHHRRLDQEGNAPPPAEGELWEMIYVGVVLLVMFVALLSDRIGVSYRYDMHGAILVMGR